MSLAADVLPPVLTASVAVAGLVVSTLTATRQYSLQQEKDREEQKRLRGRDRQADREAERRRFDERFTQAVEGLDAENAAHRIAAVVLISAMVHERDKQLSKQAFDLLLGALQRHHDRASDIAPGAVRMLLPVLENVLRQIAAQPGKRELRLARLRASCINLTRLHLQRSDLAFAEMRQSSLSAADLSHSSGYRLCLADSILNQAILREVRWHRVDGQRAKFKWATLTSAELRRGDFRGADFFQAQLQSAHFDRADLRGARFDRATLTDAFFPGAKFDETALRSVLRAKNYKRAVYDIATSERLRELAST